MFKEVLTNPSEHDPNNFIYLVHGFLDWNDFGVVNPQNVERRINQIRNPDEFYRASLVGHLDEESAKKILSWYRGNVNQVGTFGMYGLILEPANDEDICIAWNCDLGSPWDPEKLKDFANEHKGKVKGPLILLTETKGEEGIKYNEIIVKGNKKTEIEGVFYRNFNPETESEGKYLGKIVSDLLKRNVPVVELPGPKFPSYDEVTDPEERELKKRLESLMARNELMDAFNRFYRPELFRDRLFPTRDFIYR